MSELQLFLQCAQGVCGIWVDNRVSNNILQQEVKSKEAVLAAVQELLAVFGPCGFNTAAFHLKRQEAGPRSIHTKLMIDS